MAKSTPAVRATVVQRVLDGEDQVAVAEELGINRATVRTWMRRARTQPEVWERRAVAARRHQEQRENSERLHALTHWMRRPEWASAVLVDQQARSTMREALADFDGANPGGR